MTDRDQIVKEYLQYDAQTGELTWKINASRKSRAGGKAGSIDVRNRKLVLDIKGHRFNGHHVAWFLHYGVWPKENLSAINGDYSDLRIENLVEKTRSETAQSGGAHRKGGLSGEPGITWDKNRNKWAVKITRGYKQIAAGRYDNLEDAIKARDAAMKTAGLEPASDQVRKRAEEIKLASRQRLLWKRVQQSAGNVTGWSDFADFCKSIGENEGFSLIPTDPLKPVGPDNFQWIDKPSKLYDKTDLESRRAYGREYRQQNPNLFRDSQLRQKFGMTLTEYTQKLEEQNGVCAICKKPETAIRSGKLLMLAVDHCHGSGKIRDLLCINCNQGLGSFKDDINVLQQAIDYLKKHEQ